MKQRIGVIFCGWGTLDLIDQSLAPWLSLRMNPDYDICIVAVSVKFAGFEGEDDGSRERLRWYKENREIDYLIDSPDDIPETQARGMALTYLKDQGCDISIMWDSDEIIDIEGLKRAIAFMEQDQFTAAWRFSYRNLVFTPNQWLADAFCPMRAHRLCFRSYMADHFYDDNNIIYRGMITRDFRHDMSFPTVTIPSTILSPTHHTWLSHTKETAARSRAKVRYQTETRKWNCSFSWDDSQGGLIFNPVLPRPKTISE